MQSQAAHLDITERLFWSRVRKTKDACWTWLGPVQTGPGPYGIVRTASGSVAAHRLAWIYTHGDVPEGLLVCHHCDNPKCVNPAHLFLGTHKDNTQDMLEKGRKRAPIEQPTAPITVSKLAPTRKQLEVLELIKKHIASCGYAPSLREIAHEMGWSSTNGVADHLRALERKGLLRRQNMTARGLVPSDMVVAEVRVTASERSGEQPKCRPLLAMRCGTGRCEEAA